MCIFCKIINHEIPSYTIYEDDVVIAFLDITQVTKGHTLIVPKKHTESYLSCDSDTLAHVSKVAQKVANKLVDTLGCAGVNMLSNVNEVAGQSVFHFHMHIIPRYTKDDNITIRFNPSGTPDLESLYQVLKD